MLRKLVSTVIIGAVAAVAYYAYKNRSKIEEKFDDDKIIHFIEEEDSSVVEEEKEADSVTKTQRVRVKKTSAAKSGKNSE